MAYRAGKGRGRGGLDTEATARLRRRQLEEGADEGLESLNLPGRDTSQQTDFLLGNGAQKVPRCGKCTRPLDDAALQEKRLTCSRCEGTNGSRQRGPQLDSDAKAAQRSLRREVASDDGEPDVDRRAGELQSPPRRPMLANGAREVERCIKCTRPLDAYAKVSESQPGVCNRCLALDSDTGSSTYAGSAWNGDRDAWTAQDSGRAWGGHWWQESDWSAASWKSSWNSDERWKSSYARS
eukprot:TRINITY_DN39611_c0_g1_i1.p1 TRINITY_DN39611_c0_g1~~TRINITY_DN39611_c0_g1_i1.p1  ORF type:complete len:263 (+),score=37.91 TRINITY_DN39611_c0_g1_i1:78-791(+)